MASSDHTTVFVGSLDNAITEAQLAEVFGAYGPIRLVKIPYGKNVAFVEYHHPESCAPAIAALNGTPLGNGRIRVSMGIAKQERPAYGLPAPRPSYSGGGGGGWQQATPVAPNAGWQHSAPAAPYAPTLAAHAHHPQVHAQAAAAAAAPLPVAPHDPGFVYRCDVDADDGPMNAYVNAHTEQLALKLGWQLQTLDAHAASLVERQG